MFLFKSSESSNEITKNFTGISQSKTGMVVYYKNGMVHRHEVPAVCNSSESWLVLSFHYLYDLPLLKEDFLLITRMTRRIKNEE